MNEIEYAVDKQWSEYRKKFIYDYLYGERDRQVKEATEKADLAFGNLLGKDEEYK